MGTRSTGPHHRRRGSRFRRFQPPKALGPTAVTVQKMHTIVFRPYSSRAFNISCMAGLLACPVGVVPSRIESIQWRDIQPRHRRTRPAVMSSAGAATRGFTVAGLLGIFTRFPIKRAVARANTSAKLQNCIVICNIFNISAIWMAQKHTESLNY